MSNHRMSRVVGGFLEAEKVALAPDSIWLRELLSLVPPSSGRTPERVRSAPGAMKSAEV
ncbi:MAG: hypothetical protein ACPGYJ_07125 [bacterium]